MQQDKQNGSTREQRLIIISKKGEIDVFFTQVTNRKPFTFIGWKQAEKMSWLLPNVLHALGRFILNVDSGKS